MVAHACISNYLEVEIGRLWVEASLDKKLARSHISTRKKKKR
jgi:hypothetical protein